MPAASGSMNSEFTPNCQSKRRSSFNVELELELELETRIRAIHCPRIRFTVYMYIHLHVFGRSPPLINNRQPNGSLSNVLSRLAVGVRVDGDDETQRKEHEREGDQEETRHRVLACVPSEYS